MMLLILLLSTLFAGSKVGIIDGYCSRISGKPGDSLTVYLNANAALSNYPLRLYDLKGEVVFEHPVELFTQKVNSNKSWKNGYGFSPTLKLTVPNLKSGVYLWENKVPFVIKATKPNIVIVYSSNTENAYCNNGGKSLYAFNSSGKEPSSVSFLRPIALPKHSEAFLRWFNQQSFEQVGYVSDMDLDYYSEIKSAELLLIIGHSEYWTLEARKNYDRFISEGKNVIILSGNTMWWQVRYDKTKTQLLCYRTAKDDPINSFKTKTINWNDPTLNYPILTSIGAEFPLAGYGLKEDKGWNGFKISNDKSPLLEGTSLKKGNTIPLQSDEMDGTLVLGFNGKYNPVPDKQGLGFERIEIVGYDSTFRLNRHGLATWIVFKKSRSSGIVINTGTTDWCSNSGISNEIIQRITLNMITKLIRKENVFSPSDDLLNLPL